MKILVTGSAGFLGSHFYRYLKAQGHNVNGVDDMSAPHAQANRDCVDNMVDVRRWLPMMAHFDRVYHFAAPVGGRTKIEGDPMFNAESLEIDSMLFRIVSSARKKPLIIYPSSSAVYPVWMQTPPNHSKLREEDFIPESQNWGRPDEMYGFTKMAGEFLAAKAEQYGVSTMVMRPFSGYGEGQPADYPTTAIIGRVVARENPVQVWGPGTQVRDFIHVDDIVRLTEARIAAGVDGYVTMNLGTGIGTSFNELARLSATAVGYDPLIENLTDKPIGVRYRVAETWAMEHYGVPEISLEKGIERMIRYEQEQKAHRR